MTQPSPTAVAPDTYAERQSAHKRSRLTALLPVLEDFGAESFDELIDRDVALGMLASALIHSDRAALDVGITDNEDVRHLLGLGPANARAQLAGGPVDHLRPETFGLQAVDDARAVRVVTVAHGKHRRLHGREPRGKRARIVLDEHTEKPLDRSEQRAVNHDRRVALVVGTDV